MSARPTRQLFDRQKHLLGLLAAVRRPIDHIDFQKLLLLYCQEMLQEAPYEFVPYRFGAFSFTSYADIRKLTALGLVEGDAKVWGLTKEGRNVASRLRVGTESTARFVARAGALRGDALVRDTYVRFPYYAARSEIAERLLSDNPAARAAIAKVRPEPGPAGLLSIGYEGRSLESYLNALLAAGVTLLCDVRQNPLSRKYGFSKSTLSNACVGLGIQYEHVRELGVDSAKRRHLVSPADYAALFEDYRRTVIPVQRQALRTIAGWISDGHAVALTCYERSHLMCHRGCVSAALAPMIIERGAARHL